MNPGYDILKGMIILGIDPGTAITGFGLINIIGNKMTPKDYGAITTPAKMDLAKRLHILHAELSQIIQTYSPNYMAVESLFFNKNTKTALSVGHARGVILLTAEIHHIPIFSYTPTAVKTSICGYGHATKSQVQYMVKQLLNLDKIPKPDDVSDALGVAICHNHSYKIKSMINVSTQ